MTVIHTIDLEYRGAPGSIASYVVVGTEGPVMIETGPGVTTDALTRGLADLGLTPRDVRHVLVTHIHFDHAGACGWLARQGATIYVHEFGRRHLADPTRLVNSARRIYGDEMDERWGEMLPVPADRIAPVLDLDSIEVEGLRFRVLETPGHARHHHAFVLEIGDERVAFTGDAAGCFVGASPEYVSLPTPPPEFQLGAWIATVERLEEERFDRIYPTHFGCVHDPAAHLGRVKRALREHAAFVLERLQTGCDEASIVSEYGEWIMGQARAAHVPPAQETFYVKDTMATMNVSGILRYWKKLRG
ncbi:MAG: MBL fold metallo-hydrolase [Planctomycetota bacterium]|jgi:glyoxylase-like metal-dependent hydrolase (beta-lactamase superfamily II)